ncbi:MAG: ABC transporter permease [Phycisphaerales bacterium]|nr:ABC transporter permease [Phycisphaerales bacterium]
MYQALLTRRYLTSKVMPLLAAVAVMLCVAMELIVWSVMGGFGDMLKNSGRALIGDVSITYQPRGFAHYDDLIARLEADPLVEAATPAIETAGFITLPQNRGQPIYLRGVDGPGYARVTNYAQSLWWKPLAQPMTKDTRREDPRLRPDYAARLREYEEAGLSLTLRRPEDPEPHAAVVLGIEIGHFNSRQPEGWYDPYLFLPGQDVMVYVIPTDSRNRPMDARGLNFPVANQVRSGLFEIDNSQVLIRLDALQRMLNMDEARRIAPGGSAGSFVRRVNPETGREEFVQPQEFVTDPARVTSVLVRGRGADQVPRLTAVKARTEAIYREFAAAHGDVPAAEEVEFETWRDKHATLIGAVEKETVLVMFIFGVISVTSIFLVLAIFWSMVSEKTRDVGILRAMGAGRAGVAWLWLRYGLIIGLVGAVLGGVAAYSVVWNINPIHDWLGRAFGIVVWDPRVYYFSEIPSVVVWWKAAIVLGGGALASIIGALIPAVKAANMDPVRSLRFE